MKALLPHGDCDCHVEVSNATYAALLRIAKKLDCTVNAALEEVIREFQS